MPVLWVLRLSHHGEVTSRAAGRRRGAWPRRVPGPCPRGVARAAPLNTRHSRWRRPHRQPRFGGRRSAAGAASPCGLRRSKQDRDARYPALADHGLPTRRPGHPAPTRQESAPTGTARPIRRAPPVRIIARLAMPGWSGRLVGPAGRAGWSGRLVGPAGRAGRHCPANPTPGALPNGQGRGRLGSSRLPRRAARQAGLPELAGEALLQRVVVHTGALQTSADAAKRVLHGAGSLVPLLEQILERT